jgi:putative effector of murein hydrolase LrgA (UPF0299 family)
MKIYKPDILNSVSSSFLTASLYGTASWAENTISSSYALTASYVANASSFPYTGSAIITGSLIVTGSIISPISIQQISASEYTLNMGESNVILFVPSSSCVISYTSASSGQYTLIVDNTSLRSLTFATSSGWFSNLGIQPNLTGRVFISATYDGSRMFITELESMNEI